ncbi:MAG TPA: DUF885 family protein [Bryobacteraceae bacterium]|nr:DUF885 family protein [Bryobacteraceae bacterium]
MRPRLPTSICIVSLCLLLSAEPATRARVSRPKPVPYAPPDVTELLKARRGELHEVIEYFRADRGSLFRFYDTPGSPETLRQSEHFYRAWSAALDGIEFDRLAAPARIDYVLLRNKINHALRGVELSRSRLEEIRDLVPFASAILNLKEARQRVEPLVSQKAAATLVQLNREVADLSRKIDSRRSENAPRKTIARRAAQSVQGLRDMLKEWFGFYNGYDPEFTWWVSGPYKELDAALDKYAGVIRQKLVGVERSDRDTIVGDPIGREGLLAELASEMIPYTPEELLAIADKEFAWCETEMRKASRELGFGDDWLKAVEHVKSLYVPPGQQTALILELAVEAIDYLREHNLITVPALARDTWRMRMMTPERQRVNPFFTGGEVISVSYPTDGMSHEQKLMSMRGNNIHFSRATVFHELIPGHHLQQFMSARYRPYRSLFHTPFWGEGWALYWEMLLWDMGFAKTPENRVGMLFWRMHRAVRIIFSLNFHLEKMTAQEAVDFLVTKVGHERENAAAEVRRSFETDYAPLYQCAYMLGGLQFRALHKEVVGAGRMSNCEFHDAILKLNSMPVEMVRASLTGQNVTKDFRPSWRFYGAIQP